MNAHPSPPDLSTRRKAVLFCDCGHESAVDGDWLVRPAGDSERYVCPACGATVVTRPRPEPLRC